MVTCFVWVSAVSMYSTADYQCQFQSATLWIPSNKTACFNKIKFQMHRSHIRPLLFIEHAMGTKCMRPLGIPLLP